MNVKVRLVTEGDGDGPHLAGLAPCNHYAGGSSVGGFSHNAQNCPKCNGTGWVSVPVVLEINGPSSPGPG